MTAIRMAHHSDCDRLGDRTYANGNCQNLAAAIQDVTGWDIAQFTGAGDHITAVTPSGQHIDVHGLRDAATIAAQWEAGEPQVIGDINDLGWLGCDVCICDLRTARAVLEREGLLTPDIAEIADWEIDRLTD